MSEPKWPESWVNVAQPPDWALKPITGGRLSGFTDINPTWRLSTLTERYGAYGVGWYVQIVEHWTETHGDEVSAHVLVRLYIKGPDGWLPPIESFGGAMLLAQEKKGPYHCEDAFVKATTGAVGKCCQSLGFGANIYAGQDDSKYNDRERPHVDTSTAQPRERGDGDRAISDKQRKRLYAIAKGAGWQDGPMRAALKREFGYDHSSDVLVGSYDEVCRFFEAGPPADNPDSPF